MSPHRLPSRRDLPQTLSPGESDAWAWGLLDAMPDPVIITDGSRRVRGWNRRAMQLYGYEPEVTIGEDLLSVAPFVGPIGLGPLLLDRLEQRSLVDPAVFAYDDHGRGVAALELPVEEPRAEDARAVAGGGMIVIVHEPLLDEEADVGALRGRVHRKRLLLDTLIQHLGIGLVVVEAPSGAIFLQNKEAERFMSQTTVTDLESAIVDAMGAERPDGIPYTPAELPMLRALKGEAVRQEEVVYRRPDGTRIPFSVSATPVRDDFGRVIFAIATFDDISVQSAREEDLREKEEELTRLNARLLYDALHDVLTGLPNRTLLLDRLEQVLQRRLRDPDRDAALLYLDFDRFKIVNDSLGHAVGDAMLIAIAETISNIVRPEDTVARLGGDEFVILMDHLDSPDRAVDLAQRIRKTFTEPLAVDERQIFTSASVGIVPSLVGYTNADDVLRDADTAMYAAKEAGRARHRVFDQRMRNEALAALELENGLWQALALNQFTVLYGPIHRLDDASVVGFEALVRWEHPERGLLIPRDFLQTATEMGIGRDIDQLVWRQACEAANEWRERFDPELVLSLNFNARHFLSPKPEQAILQTLEEMGADAGRTAIELSEGTLHDATDEANAALLKIVSQGVRLHLDNFGSGHHSLYSLQRFNVGAIKIDQNLVASLNTDPKSIELIRAITAMAESLKLDVIAKGVTDEAQRQQLLELGCTYAQGDLFSVPLDQDGAKRLLQEQAERKG